jgi:hypothetical protein
VPMAILAHRQRGKAEVSAGKDGEQQERLRHDAPARSATAG